MNICLHKSNQARRASGMGVVVLLHVAIFYALVSGLATKVVEVVRRPIVAKIIDAPRPPPPVPVSAAPPPPKAAPVRVAPRVRLPVQAPAQPRVVTAQPDLSAPSVQESPTAPVPLPSAPSAPAPVAGTKPASVGVVCPNSNQVRASIRYPREAQRDGITGNVLIEFSVTTDGAVKDIVVVKSADPILDRAAQNAVTQFKCVAQGQDVRVQVPFSFSLGD